MRCVGRGRDAGRSVGRSSSISHKSRVFVTQRASERGGDRRRKRDVKWTDRTARSVSAICSVDAADDADVSSSIILGVVNIANSRGEGRDEGREGSRNAADATSEGERRGRALRRWNTILAKWFRSPYQYFHIN